MTPSKGSLPHSSLILLLAFGSGPSGLLSLLQEDAFPKEGAKELLSALILLPNSCYSCLWKDTFRTVSIFDQNVRTKSGQWEQHELLLILLNNGALACCPTSCNWDGEHILILFFSRTVVNYVVPCVNESHNYKPGFAATEATTVRPPVRWTEHSNDVRCNRNQHYAIPPTIVAMYALNSRSSDVIVVKSSMEPSTAQNSMDDNKGVKYDENGFV